MILCNQQEKAKQCKENVHVNYVWCGMFSVAVYALTKKDGASLERGFEDMWNWGS